MDYQHYDLIGNLGVAMIVGTYFLIQIGKMSSRGLSYTILNGLGAACILYSLLYDFNMSAFIVELFWMAISLVGLGRIYLEHRRKLTQSRIATH
jgi:multidrug transporter EmrE-like cation transporter